ncbi:dicarboxylate/amino acid:cation symporter [Sandarakinorhabdus sp. DWP1-3-1]|uniref:dicarboxylate/amino acid:cation symporter n=1 Tax=Sandarakinorhabdus sp. DWP1-3-1 TaxID=2804627 RepID=UPI003CFA86EB
MDISKPPVRPPGRMPGRSTRILIGLAAGLATGVAIAGSNVAAPVVAIARPVGKLWIDALTMTVVPLVFSLLVTGIAGAAGSAGGRVARQAMLWFAGLLVLACVAAAAATTLALAAWPVPAEAGALRSAGPAPDMGAAGAWLDNIIPTNPLRAAADTAMVPLVVFAMFMGFALSRIDAPLREALLAVFKGLAQAMLVIVGWVLWLAPIGVFALAIGVGLTAGVGAAGVLLHYMVMVIGACLLGIALAYAAAALAGRLSPLAFGRAALPAQVVAMSTQSSLASLPAMIAAAAPLGVDRAAAGIVLPLAVSIFRMSSAAANIAVAIYLGHVHGVELSLATLALGALVAAAVSVAAVGLPAQVSFFAVVGPVCLAMGVPLTLLPLLLAIETIPDIFRTIGNVTGGLAVTRIVGRAV